jgi:hypothetical protein
LPSERGKREIKSIVAQFGPKSDQMAEARSAQKELSDKIKAWSRP